MCTNSLGGPPGSLGFPETVCAMLERTFFNGFAVIRPIQPGQLREPEAYLNFKKLITSDAVAAMAQTGARTKNFQNFLKLGAR
jgi:hypothetical protein